MKYTAEQFKDLIFLSKNSCAGRLCFECLWQSQDTVKRCILMKSKRIYTELSIKEEVKKRIQEIIENEIHN